MKKVFFTIIIFSLFSPLLLAKDRCQDFVPDIRQSSIQYLGLGFPYQYNIGCAIVESNCRADIISFDGGIGLFQLTPSTGITKRISKYIAVDPYNVQSNIRAQAFYLSLLINQDFKRKSSKIKGHIINPVNYVNACGLNLADIYRHYNGGDWFFYESTRKSGVDYICENREMFKYCVRTGTWVGSGKNRRWLSFCEVNYSYPEKIYKYAQKYNNGLKSNYRFWHEKSLDLIFLDSLYAY